MRTAMQSAQYGLNADDARALTDRVLNLSRANNARVTVRSGRRTFVRCADNRITTAGGSTDVSVNIMSVFGQRVASVSTNRIEEDALAQAVRRCEELARLAPENPEYLAELEPQQYQQVNGYHAGTGEVSSETLAAAAALEIRAAQGADAIAAGYIDVRAGSRAIATSNGLFAYHPSTGVASTLTVRTPDGSSSGWAGDEAGDWDNIETERIAADAVRKCQEWRGKTDLAPGRYEVVLEPTAAGMLMARMTGAFNARRADEGRSFFSKPDGGNRIGERLFDRQLTIRSNPALPDAETAPFTGEGLPRSTETWVENGVLRNLAYSRFWANRQGTDPRSGPANIIMSGGSASVDDMIRSTRRGVLITRFWYIRGLNPRTLAYTGLTRDGTFLIENGRISQPVNNFRFNQSLVDMLSNIQMLGRPTRVAAGENSSVGTPMVVPAMKVSNFHLASVSDAI